MAHSLERLVSSVRTLCGEPPDCDLASGGLPSHLIFETLLDIESSMNRDMDLGTTNRRVAKMDIELDGDTFLVPQHNFHAPSYVTLQIDPSSNVWWPVEIVEHSSLGQMAALGKLAIAFSGSPPRGYFSWTPDTPQLLRIWYERTGNDHSVLGGSTDVGGLYDEYLKIQAVAQCMEYLKMPIGDVLRARIAKGEKQWQKFTNRGNQRGLGSKSPVNRRRHWPMVDRTRFYVP